MALDYAKKLTTFPLSSKRQHLPVPTAPLVIVHGGAGSGKSRLISSIYNMVPSKSAPTSHYFLSEIKQGSMLRMYLIRKEQRSI